MLNTLKERPELATNSPISFPAEYQSTNTVTIDRGENKSIRVVVNYGPDNLLQEDTKPTNGYRIIKAGNYDYTTGVLDKYGYLILEKPIEAN